MYNGLSQVYCIIPEERIHLYTKGLSLPPSVLYYRQASSMGIHVINNSYFKTYIKYFIHTDIKITRITEYRSCYKMNCVIKGQFYNIISMYRKMTTVFLFFFPIIVKFYGKKIRSHNMTMLYLNPYYNNMCYKGTVLYSLKSQLIWLENRSECAITIFIIYLQRNSPDTTPFLTQKYKILYHPTRVIFFRITILHVLPTSQA